MDVDAFFESCAVVPRAFRHAGTTSAAIPRRGPPKPRLASNKSAARSGPDKQSIAARRASKWKGRHDRLDTSERSTELTLEAILQAGRRGRQNPPMLAVGLRWRVSVGPGDSRHGPGVHIATGRNVEPRTPTRRAPGSGAGPTTSGRSGFATCGTPAPVAGSSRGAPPGTRTPTRGSRRRSAMAGGEGTPLVDLSATVGRRRSRPASVQPHGLKNCLSRPRGTFPTLSTSRSLAWMGALLRPSLSAAGPHNGHATVTPVRVQAEGYGTSC
jgi:hypothetical protein